MERLPYLCRRKQMWIDLRDSRKVLHIWKTNLRCSRKEHYKGKQGLRDSRKDQTGGDNVCVAHAETNPKKKLACVAHARAKQSCMGSAWPTQGRFRGEKRFAWPTQRPNRVAWSLRGPRKEGTDGILACVAHARTRE